MEVGESMNDEIYVLFGLTTMRKRVLRKKRMYPAMFLFRVSTFASLYARMAMVPIANGW